MSVIRVRYGLMGTSFEQALQRARPGDVIQLPEGNHDVGGLTIRDLTILGTGDPARTVVGGPIAMIGTSRLANLSVQAGPFHNAIATQPSSRIRLESVILLGDPAHRYPAVWAREGTFLSMSACTVVQDRAVKGLSIERGSTLEADSSRLGIVEVLGASVSLHNIAASGVWLSAKARMRSRGDLVLDPDPTRRAFTLDDESSAFVEMLHLGDERVEGYCRDSFLQVSAAAASGDGWLDLIHEGTGRIDSDTELISVRRPNDVVEAAPPTQAEPQVVVWRARDAHRFSEIIAPRLRVGDTILLEEGEYDLGDPETTRLILNCELAGKGLSERTILHFAITCPENATLTLSNLTIKPPEGCNAVVVQPGGTARLTDVVVHQTPASEAYPAIHVTDGQLTLDSCRVVGLDTGDPSVYATQGSHVAANNSDLAWLSLSGGSVVELADCSIVQAWVDELSTLISHERLVIEPNDLGLRSLVAEDAAVELASVQTSLPGCEFFLHESSVTIGSAELHDAATLTVVVSGYCPRDLPESVTIVDAADLVAPVEAEGVPLNDSDPGRDTRSDAGVGDYPTPDPDSHPQDPATDELPDPLTQINLLTGLDVVKQQIGSFVATVKFNQLRRQQGLKTSGQTLHSMFLGNPGTGKTTVARLLGQVLHEAGATRTDTFVEVGRKDLVGNTLGSSARLTDAACQRALGGVLFIDEAYTLYQERNNEFGQEAVDTLLAFMENHRDDLVVILAGYHQQMQDFIQMNPGLRSRVPHTFDFDDYTADEIATIGYRMLTDDDYVVDEDVYRRVVTRQYLLSVDGGNGRWVRNFNEHLVARMAERVVRQLQTNPFVDSQTILDADLYDLAGGDAEQHESAITSLLAELDALEGLREVKQWAHDLVREARANELLAQSHPTMAKPSYHMLFTGNPGTGKTTVAALIAQMFYHLGILQRNTVKVVDRSDLVGAWIGHTEKQTTRAVDEAMGGVLFVDEAYQLSAGANENDFGKLAIETLITRLENDRTRFVAIFAGYTDQMQQFLASNPGLRSRIPYAIEFPDYSPEEVGRIVAARLSHAWSVDADMVIEVAASTYAALPPAEKSNGRWARNFAEQVEKVHKLSLLDNPTGDLSHIDRSSVEAAARSMMSGS